MARRRKPVRSRPSKRGAASPLPRGRAPRKSRPKGGGDATKAPIKKRRASPGSGRAQKAPSALAKWRADYVDEYRGFVLPRPSRIGVYEGIVDGYHVKLHRYEYVIKGTNNQKYVIELLRTLLRASEDNPEMRVRVFVVARVQGEEVARISSPTGSPQQALTFMRNWDDPKHWGHLRSENAEAIYDAIEGGAHIEFVVVVLSPRRARFINPTRKRTPPRSKPRTKPKQPKKRHTKVQRPKKQKRSKTVQKRPNRVLKPRKRGRR